ncbi:MAG TPA: hypothetical protein VI256_00625, partial [Roseiarcus sp.]
KAIKGGAQNVAHRHYRYIPSENKKELARKNKPCTYHLHRGARKTAIADRTLPVREGRLL